MVLPAELIDYIFSFLQEDTSALKACSKADPLLSKLAKPHLYAHIVVNPKEPEVGDLLIRNPHLLVHPRTLKITGSHHLFSTRNSLAMSTIPMIPQMTNLISLSIIQPYSFDQKEEFFSAFRTVLKQSSFHQLYLSFLYDVPLSVIDDAKNIKQLTLSDCTADEGPISSSPSSQLSLETLILSHDFNPDLHRWAMRWVTRLTTLELVNPSSDLDWTAFPELLVACSNSLTRLHLDIEEYCSYGGELPFTLSALMQLKRLSISSLVLLTATECRWALPEIIRIVNTAPSIPVVVLRFHFRISDSITASLARLDWSLLGRLQSNLTGKRPRIDLCVDSEDILKVVAANEELKDLVNRGLVVLSSESRSS